jgi:hypothetical protein
LRLELPARQDVMSDQDEICCPTVILAPSSL